MSIDGDSTGHRSAIERTRSRLGPEPVLVGWTAAVDHGLDVGPGPAAVHVAGVTPRRARGLVAHRLALDPADVVAAEGGRRTSDLRTAMDLARGVGTAELAIDHRVVLLDAFLHLTRMPAVVARERAMSESGLWGLRDGRRVLALARDGVQSPKESELRLLLRHRRWPEPIVQCPVTSPGGMLVAHLDLGWPEFRVGVEYDGAVHRDRAQHSRDMERHNAILAGWLVLQVGTRLLRQPDRLCAELAELVRLQRRRS
ncbi:MAG: hypothetical protein ACFCVF_01750 [Kineosporiaceae bacterium]